LGAPLFVFGLIGERGDLTQRAQRRRSNARAARRGRRALQKRGKNPRAGRAHPAPTKVKSDGTDRGADAGGGAVGGGGVSADGDSSL
jgi:hypothetical protein